MTKHVISTLSADTRYAQWVNNHGVNTVERSVLVKGGAGVATSGPGKPSTPGGLITHISDDDAKFLSEHDMFKEHQERGFVKIVTVARDPETVSQSMSKDDGSRPRSDQDVADFAVKKGGDDTLKVVTNAK